MLGTVVTFDFNLVCSDFQLCLCEYLFVSEFSSASIIFARHILNNCFEQPSLAWQLATLTL